MIKKHILTFFTLFSLSFANCEGTTSYGSSIIIQDYNYTTSDIEGEKRLDINMRHIPTNKNPLKISITIFNPLDYTVHIPLNTFPLGTDENDENSNSFTILEDGNKLTYTSSKINASFYGTIVLAPNATYHTSINLDENYNAHKGTHTYNIIYPRADHSLEFDTTIEYNNSAQILKEIKIIKKFTHFQHANNLL